MFQPRRRLYFNSSDVLHVNANDGNIVAISDCLEQRPASSNVTFEVALEINWGSAASQRPLPSPEYAGSTVCMLPVSPLC